MALLAVLIATALLDRRPTGMRPSRGGVAGETSARLLVGAAVLLYVATAALIALSVPDPLGPRVVLPVAGLLLLATIRTAVNPGPRAVRNLAHAVVCVLAAVAVARAGYWIERSVRGVDSGLSWSTRLVPPCAPNGDDCGLAPDERRSPIHSRGASKRYGSTGEPQTSASRSREGAGRLSPVDPWSER